MPLTVMAAAESCSVILPAPRDFQSMPLLYYGRPQRQWKSRARVGWVERQRNPSRQDIGKVMGFAAAQPILPSAGGDVTDQICEIHKNLTYATHDDVELKGDLYLPAGPGP